MTNYDDDDDCDDDYDYDDNNSKVTGLSPDTAYTVVMETSLGLGISHQVALVINLHTDDDDGGGVDKIVVGWKVFKIIMFF